MCSDDKTILNLKQPSGPYRLIVLFKVFYSFTPNNDKIMFHISKNSIKDYCKIPEK